MKILKGFILFFVILTTLALVSCGELGIDSENLKMQIESRTISGYQIITQDTSVSTSVTKQLRVTCPEGMKAIGASWGVLDSTGVILDGTATYFMPAFDGSSWLVNAKLRNHSSREWKLRVSVICTSESSLSGYEIIRGDTSVSYGDSKSLSLDCPAGKKAVGAGWAVLDSTNIILPGKATYFMPSYNGSSWLTKASYTASWSEWKLRSYLICVDSESLPNYQIVTADSELSGLPTKQVFVLSPDGKNVTSAGWGVLDSTDAILPGEALYFLPKYGESGWVANALENVTWPWDGLWKLRVRLICIN